MLTLSVVTVIVIAAIAVIAILANRFRATRWLSIVADVFLLLMLVLACGSMWFGAVVLNREPAPLPFSVEGWNSARYDEEGSFSYVRYRMVDNLLKRYDLHGWSMTEVENLLKQPDKVEDKDSKRLIYYDLGNGLDFLILELDTESRVNAYRVYKH